MRSILTLSLLAAASTVNAHAYFHKAFVNDVDQGQLFGVRAPESNSPIQDVTSSAITCNAPLRQPLSKDVIDVNPGDKFGMQWNHGINGPESAGDADDPIAASHKGPVMAYMAKVDDASSSDGSGLQWFKVAEEGLDTTTGKWGVDSKFSFLHSYDLSLHARSSHCQQGPVVLHHALSRTRRLSPPRRDHCSPLRRVLRPSSVLYVLRRHSGRWLRELLPNGHSFFPRRLLRQRSWHLNQYLWQHRHT